jgi:UrcA family protein
MPNVRQFAFAAAAITGLCASATPAFAQEQEIVVSGKVKAPDGYEAVTQKVKIGDLNLASAAAVRLLDKRVGNAINALCSRPRQESPGYEKRDAKLCRDVAWASARPQMRRAIQKATDK